MGLDMGGLTDTAISSLKTKAIDEAPDVSLNGSSINSVEDAKENIGSVKDSFKDFSKKLPAECLASSTTGAGTNSKKVFKFNLKPSCEPLVKIDGVKEAIELDGRYEDYKSLDNKEIADDVLTKAVDRLNSNTISAKGRTALNKLNTSNCNPFPNLGIPSLDGFTPNLPGLGLNSLLHSAGDSLEALYGTISKGLGFGMGDLISCGESGEVTAKSLTMAESMSTINTSDGILDSLKNSGNLDLGLMEVAESDKYSNLLEESISTTDVKKLKLNNAFNDTSVDDIFGKLSNVSNYGDISKNKDLVATANTNSLLKSDITDNTITNSDKVSLFSKLVKDKIKLVA